MKKRPPIPPWLCDSKPDHWAEVSVAAKIYFHKSIVTVKRYIKTGYLDEVGIPSYWDGKRWHVRLPVALFPARRKRSVQSERATA